MNPRRWLWRTIPRQKKVIVGWLKYCIRILGQVSDKFVTVQGDLNINEKMVINSDNKQIKIKLSGNDLIDCFKIIYVVIPKSSLE